MGIPVEDLGVIFDKFQRSRDQMMKQTEGSGPALKIARQIIEHHGGSISVSSTYGAGTTMTVSLPAARSGASSMAAEGAPSAIIS